MKVIGVYLIATLLIIIVRFVSLSSGHSAIGHGALRGTVVESLLWALLPAAGYAIYKFVH
jgi:hypothetical protein